MKYLFAVCIAMFLACAAGAQTRTLTNSDLTGYAQQRENAEREYRENYARRGMPSPEEIIHRREVAARETREYADRIREQEAEILRAVAAQAAMRPQPQSVIIVNGQGGYDTGYFLSTGSYYGGQYYGRGAGFNRGYRQFGQSGYYAGGQFWPTGGATPSRPIISAGPRPMISPGPRH